MITLSTSTYRWAASALLVAIAVLLGGWWGRSQANPDAAPPASSSANAKVSPPSIPLPPLLYVAKATEAAKLQPSPLGTPTTMAGAPPEEIQPAGVGSSATATDLLWETTANQPWQVRPQPITPPNWYITGVVRRGEQTQVIVQFDGEPMPRMFKVGDTLPGGAKLGWIRPNAIGVITPNKRSLDVPVLGGEPAARTLPPTKR